MRLFIAIELSDPVKDSLTQIQSHLKYAAADVKWVERDNIHLTLKFLGEIDEKKAAVISTILDNIAKDFSPFEITIKDLGVFPKMDFPRVVWVGLEEKGAKIVEEIFKKIEERLVELGFDKEARAFTSHITIGRVRSPKNKEALKEKILSYDLSPTTKSPISSIILFQSTLTPKGSIYTKLHEAQLCSA